MGDETQARERIVEAATALIRQYGDFEKITMRDIAARAGVGVGLINYHFQTKENLINQCVQKIIGNIIGGFDALYKSLDMPPLEKLKFLLRENASFLANYSGISRASIVHDMLSGYKGDNTTQVMEAYLPVLREVCGQELADSALKVRLHVMISALQAAFLRKEALKETLGLDFLDKAQRDELADGVVDSLFI